jgi:hypothetical protein
MAAEWENSKSTAYNFVPRFSIQLEFTWYFAKTWIGFAHIMAKIPLLLDIVVFYATPGCEAGFSKAALKTVMLFFHLNYGILLTGFKLVCLAFVRTAIVRF